MLAAGVGTVAVFGALRAASPNTVTLLLTTLGVGVGIALAGASLPIMVKEQFPAQPLRATATYTTGLQVGAVASAALAIPIASLLGGWRWALLTFAIATAACFGVFVMLTRRSQSRVLGELSNIRLRLDGRTITIAGAFALFCFAYYGLASWLPSAYISFGWTPAASGVLIALLNLGSLLGSFGIVLWAGRLAGGGLALTAGVFALSVAGLVLTPQFGYPLALISGISNGALLALMLALPVKWSSGPHDAALRSAVTIGVGYTVASVGPVTVGALRDVSNSFTVALSAVVGISLALWFVCLGIAIHAQDREG
jgi:CP family cyanate transporter-like MFS transporter